MSSETVRCPFCMDGEWFANPDFDEPYGYKYRPPRIPCGVCHGTKAILREEVDRHPDLRQITEEERAEYLKRVKT